MAIFAPLIAPHPYDKMDVATPLVGAGEEGLILGSDNFGRDIFSRIVYGSRISLIVGVGAVLFGGLIGTLLGLVSGYYGGLIDSIIMRLMDGLFAFPSILLAIAFMTVFGQGLFNVI